MRDDGKTVTLLKGWPQGVWCPEKAVADRMTRGEVSALIASVRRELDWLSAWSEHRPEPQMQTPAWEMAPPPNSSNDYGKLRTR